jgi:hypothetical protein
MCTFGFLLSLVYYRALFFSASTFGIMAPKLLRSSEEMCDAISALFDFATADDVRDRIMYEIGSSTCFFFLMNSLVRHDENGLQVILKESEVGGYI